MHCSLTHKFTKRFMSPDAERNGKELIIWLTETMVMYLEELLIGFICRNMNVMITNIRVALHVVKQSIQN